jgi:tetratricopeptide (TPR) repeat protein
LENYDEAIYYLSESLKLFEVDLVIRMLEEIKYEKFKNSVIENEKFDNSYETNNINKFSNQYKEKFYKAIDLIEFVEKEKRGIYFNNIINIDEKLNEALKIFNEGLELYPNSAILYERRSCVYFMKKEYEKSKVDSIKGVELGKKDDSFPKGFKIFYFIDLIVMCNIRAGLCNRGLNNYEEALIYFNEALKLDNTDLIRGMIYETKMLNINNNNNFDNSIANASKNQGNEYFRKKEYKLAIIDYDNAIKLNPNEMIFYLNKSACYLELGEFEKSIKEARTSIEIGLKFNSSKGKVLL